MKPNLADAYFNRGKSEIHLGKNEMACADWQKAVSLGNNLAVEYISKNCH